MCGVGLGWGRLSWTSGSAAGGLLLLGSFVFWRSGRRHVKVSRSGILFYLLQLFGVGRRLMCLEVTWCVTSQFRMMTLISNQGLWFLGSLRGDVPREDLYDQRKLIATMFSSLSTAPQFRLCDSWHRCWCLHVCWIGANTNLHNNQPAFGKIMQVLIGGRCWPSDQKV